MSILIKLNGIKRYYDVGGEVVRALDGVDVAKTQVLKSSVPAHQKVLKVVGKRVGLSPGSRAIGRTSLDNLLITKGANKGSGGKARHQLCLLR